MTLRIKSQANTADLVELIEVKNDVRVAVNGDTILYLHADGRAIFYPANDSDFNSGRWKKE